MHLYQAISHLLRLIGTILPVVQSLLSSLCAGKLTPTSAPTLVRVAVARGRVLCPECHGENDDMFHFCQWCATPSTCDSISTEEACLSIDEAALGARYTQFTTSLENKTSTVRREAATTLLGQFLSSRTTGGAVGMATAQPRDIVQFLCWLDSCSNRRRTVVHAMHCTQVGTADLAGCSTQPGECAKRYAHDSLRINYVSKLAVAYERDLGITTDWSDALRIGNPIRSDLVTQYMTFTREAQKKAGVAVKQAPAVLPSHLHTIVSPLRSRLQCTSDPYTRVVLARDLALFTVAFETTKRGDELSRTLIQRIFRLPNLSGFLFNFQWGKTMRDGADHLISVAYNHDCLATCPFTAVEQLVAIGSAIGWDMTRGYLFPSISRDAEGGAPIRGKAPMSAAEMTHALKSHARAAGEKADFSMHSFRSGGAITRALRGEDLSSIMERAFWKRPSTAWRYMRIMEIVSPGAVGNAVVKGVSAEQYRQINEFSLSEQSKSWSAFGTEPMT